MCKPTRCVAYLHYKPQEYTNERIPEGLFDFHMARSVQVRVKGFFAIVERGGGCGFGDKVIAAQTAGAVGVVVVNKGEGDKGKSQAMMADKDQSALVKVPAFMVSAALLEDIRDDELVRQIAKNKGTALHSNVRFGIVGRFIFEDFYGDYD